MGERGVVRGASSLARKLTISPLIIGLTVVAFGTSSPELGVSIFAGIQGKDDIAIANVVGSNIFNILMAIGVPAAISSIKTSMGLLLRELPILSVVTFVAAILAFLGYQINRPEALILCVGLAMFIGYSYWAARQESEQILEEYDEGVGKETQTWLSVVFVALGVALLVLGSRFVVWGGNRHRDYLGYSRCDYWVDSGGDWHVFARIDDLNSGGVKGGGGHCYWQCAREQYF